MDDYNKEDDFEISDDVLKILNEMDREATPEEIKRNKEKRAKELESKGFLPENYEFSGTMSSPQEAVEANPRQFIIEECLPACEELWSKNIYTFMVSDHLNEGVCWIEIIADGLSDENKDIFANLSGDDVVKFSYHKGSINFGVNCVGSKGQARLLELAKQFQMQDVPEHQAYISMEKFLMNYCGCYDEIPNPNYSEMQPFWEMNLPQNQLVDYMDKYYEWKDSPDSKETLKQFNPNKLTRPVNEIAAEEGMIIDGDRVYLSEFHYKKHEKYLKYMQEQEERHI